MQIIGIDVGTSGAKAAVFEPGRRMVACVREPYSCICPAKGLLELDPEEVWQAVVRCLKRLAGQADASQVGMLAVSTQGEAVVPVDREGKPLMNAILTFDSRNAEEFGWFAGQTDRFRVMEQTGMPSHPMFSATKLLWLRNHAPDGFEKAWKFFCFGDYIAFRLGAAPAIDYAMASRTMLFDLRARRWSEELTGLCGIPVEKLPEPVAAGTPIGTAGPVLTSLGYPDTLRLFCGSHDQICCSLGAGVFDEGVAMDSLGTTESIVCVSSRLTASRQNLACNIPVYPYPGEGLYAYMTFLTTCASLLEWFRTKLLDAPEEGFYAQYDQKLTELRDQPASVFALPYFAGAGTPQMDFRAQGLFAGLTLDTDRYQLYRAILEGTCFEGRLNLANMESCGISVRELRCIGGGARSAPWLQMKADITGRRVVSMACEEAGCLGAVMLAGMGSGQFRSLREAGGDLLHERGVFLPDPERAARYEEAYQTYLKLYPAGSTLYTI